MRRPADPQLGGAHVATRRPRVATQAVTVVGAGVIGAAIALRLREEGLPVVLVDRGSPGCGASFGNMSGIAATEFMPMSRPDVWDKIPRWLLHPDGPIRLRPSYAGKMLPWLARFLWAGRPASVAALEEAGAALCRRAYLDLLPLLQRADLASLLREEGCLNVYASDRELAADSRRVALIKRFGFDCELLDAKALHALEPELSPRLEHALLLPQWRLIEDPYRFTQALVARFCRLGGTVRRHDVVDVAVGGAGIRELICADGTRLTVDTVVVACGAWSGHLAARLREPIPLETERGYHTQIMMPGIALRHSVTQPARAFVVAPVGGGIRVGGTVEMAGLDAPPDMRRARILVRHARAILPRLEARDSSEWMGHRPALPDTIPIIGRSAKWPKLFYATGHGHLGLTLAATTAQLISDLVLERQPPIDMSPYRINRFARLAA